VEAFGWRLEGSVEVEGLGGAVDLGLGVEEAVGGVGVGEVADDDLAVFDGVVFAVVEGVAEGLEKGEGAFAAGGIAGVSDDGVDGAVSAVAVDDGSGRGRRS
jgi:hypothetical protein